jgi:4-amino-4-deoxy-L-arabinose transferase-like glycosyltransferase
VSERWRTALRDFAQRPRAVLLLVGGLALVLRVAMALWMPNAIAWEDGVRYMKVADNLLAGHGFGGIWDNAQSVPTQPVLLAGLSLLFGTHYTLFRLVFAVLGTVTCLLGTLLARRLFGPFAALLAGVLLAVYPQLVYLSILFEYPQALFVLLLAAFFLAIHVWYDTGGRWLPSVAGLLFGLAVLTVPTVLAFVPVLVVCLVWRAGWRAVPALLVLLLCAALPVTAWGLRNQRAYGEFILVNKAAGSNFWMSNNDTYYTYGKAGVVPVCAPGYEFTPFCIQWSDVAQRVLNSRSSDLEAVNAYEQAGWAHGKAFLAESPARTAQLMLRKFALFWGPLPDSVQLSDRNVPMARTLGSIITYLPILVLALAACWWERRRWRDLLLLWGYIAAMSAPYCLLLPVMRYRLPIDFMLLILAGAALARGLRPRASTA